MPFLTFVIPLIITLEAQSSPPLLDGITFAGSPIVYLPARNVANFFDLPVRYSEGQLTIGASAIPSERALVDGSRLVYVRDLEMAGVELHWDASTRTIRLLYEGMEMQIQAGKKRVEIDLKTQQLMAYQGGQVVFRSHVSSGRRGHRTPSGTWTVKSKERMHYSRLYDNAPMPWSVQVIGNVYIHGYSEVPRYPASHGCVRLPIPMAKWFYGWVERGVPVQIR